MRSAESAGRVARLIAFGVLFAFAPIARGGTIPPHPIPESDRWATITHPGNEPFVYQTSGGNTRTIGRVDHEYQIMRTEVTYAEWYEFVVAYAPYIEPNAANAPFFTGRSIGQVGPGQYYLPPFVANLGTEVGWRYAARYCNWLHNGKALHRDAFESGVYDTSTFGSAPEGGFTDQQTRSPGATYWIPSEDEWVKSVYYDPHKNGPDQPGYWRYPISADTLPIPGPPGAGQTSAGANNQGFFLPDVASYRDVQSPWGLWDASGGRREWTEGLIFDIFYSPHPINRITRGVGWRDVPYTIGFEELDRIDIPSLGFSAASPNQLIGLRLARAVPGAPGAGVFLCTLTLILRRRRMSRVEDRPCRSCHMCCRVPDSRHA